MIAEPLHVHGIAPIWIYTAPSIVRSGHAWVEITAQKTTLDLHVKPSNPARYEDLQMDGPDSADFDLDPRLGDPDAGALFWNELIRRNRDASTILAQVGAALREPEGPFDGWPIRAMVLAGHSQTGSVTSYYIEDAHIGQRRADGAPVYDGYFPSGFPYEPFHDVDVPIVQVMSEGDVVLPDYSFRPGHAGRCYRRDDSDDAGDRYRLYELAGAPHMGTRDAPFDDVSLWEGTHGAEATREGVTLGPRMNSLPTFELFAMGLEHLVQWVANDKAPPRAERLEVGPRKLDLEPLGPGRHRAVGHPLHQVVEAHGEELEVGQAVHPRADGDALRVASSAVRALPQGHVVERRVAGAHVGDAGEFVEAVAVAGSSLSSRRYRRPP